MNENSKVSSKQIRSLVVSTVVGIGILGLPSKIAAVLGNDGWIAIILGGLLIVPIIIFMNKIFQFYPGKDFFQIGHEVLGKWVFNSFLLIFLFYLIMLASFVTRNMAEIVKAFLLETTPTEVIIITFILVTSYIARSDINIIGRISYHVYPIILGFVIIVTLITLTGLDFTNMLPLFQSNIKDFPKGIGITFFSYLGFEILLFVLPFAEEREKTVKYSLIGIGFVIVMYLIIFVISLSQYGLEHLQRQLFPTLALIKEVDLPGFFIENLDGVVMGVWVLVIAGTMGPVYYSAGKVISNLFSTKSHDLFIIPLLPIIYLVSLIPQSLIEVNVVLAKMINYCGLISIVLMPALIFCIGYYKIRRSER